MTAFAFGMLVGAVLLGCGIMLVEAYMIGHDADKEDAEANATIPRRVSERRCGTG